jgi:hypothetical protein
MSWTFGTISWLVEEFVNGIGLKVKDTTMESRDVLVVRHI